jgi:hypothetical protein
MERLLRKAGFESIRTWKSEFGHRYLPEEFLLMRTRRGTSRRRFESLSSERQRALLRRVRERFAGMEPEDFVDRSEMIFATAIRC